MEIVVLVLGLVFIVSVVLAALLWAFVRIMQEKMRYDLREMRFQLHLRRFHFDQRRYLDMVKHREQFGNMAAAHGFSVSRGRPGEDPDDSN